MPVAAAVLLLTYLQAAFGLIPLRHDPLARLVGVGMGEVAAKVAAAAQGTGADAILTGDYETTAWLRFYTPGLPVIAVDQPNRYLDAPSAMLTGGSYLYLRDTSRKDTASLAAQFLEAKKSADIPRQRGGSLIATYEVWRLEMPKRTVQGKMP
jgi:hypothetical protein